jgi:hypothetical protein
VTISFPVVYRISRHIGGFHATPIDPNPVVIGIPDYGGGTVIEDTVKSAFAPGQVQRWEVPTRGDGAGLIVYRLEDGEHRLRKRA